MKTKMRKLLGWLYSNESLLIGFVLGELFVATILVNIVYLLGFISTAILAILRLVRTIESDTSPYNKKPAKKIKKKKIPTL